jgi:2-polyprenyl-3-methyl-5-hydroxy-6-metoxy-1,4-benzoquinol methylase
LVFYLLHKRYKNDGIPIIKLNPLQLDILNRVKLNLRQRIYKFEKVPCCICNNLDFTLLSEKERHGFYNPVVICKNCGLIQNNPRMNQESYLDFYENIYRKFMSGQSSSSKLYFKKEYDRGKEILRFMKKAGVLNTNNEKLFIFEVGCGAGGILKVFQEQGFEVQGCDLDNEYLEYGIKNENLILRYGTLHQISLKKQPDIIIYSHVLEHILNLKEELTLIYKILKNGGYLYIEVPGVKNIIKSHEMNFLHYLHYHHVYHFSLITLKNLLSINGFKLIKGNNVIKCIAKKSDVQIFDYEIKNDYENVLKFLQKMEKARRKLIIIKSLKIFSQSIKNNLLNFKTSNRSLRSIKSDIKSLLLRYLKQIHILRGLVYKILEKL